MSIGKALLRKNGLDREMRIALAKPDVHNDLYYRTSPALPRDIVYSSILRSGPVALFTALDADFVVVKTDDRDQGCRSWHQKVDHCKHHSHSYFQSFRGSVRRYGKDFDHSQRSIDPASIDWSIYDLVIAIDLAVPYSARERHKGVVWAYYTSEPCMPIYADSLESPQFGYDLFLTLGLSWLPPKDRAAHVIEFPYFLQYADCFEDLDGAKRPDFWSRSFISCERHTRTALTSGERKVLEPYGQIDQSNGPLPDLINMLRHSRFMIRLNAKPLWGNSLVEAMAVGTLVIASPETLKHRLMVREL